jgi:hypothetical protein
MNKPNTITIDEVLYIRADSVQDNTPAEKIDGLEYCVIRTYSAGVHIGYVKRHAGQEVELINSRRLWNWSKAASLSQVAIEGCKSEKFAMELPKLILTDCIEIIPCSEKARKTLSKLKEWKS